MIGVVTGLKMEAMCCPRNVTCICNGPGEKRASAACRKLLKVGIDGIVSFGLAGALSNELKPGCIILASEVVLSNGHQRIPTCSLWRKRFQSRLTTLLPTTSTVEDKLASSNRVIRSCLERTELLEGTGAIAVDMESGAVATYASYANIPFLVVRVIVDSLRYDLPDTVLTVIDSNGNCNLPHILSMLVKHPLQGKVLMQLGLDTFLALSMLRRVARKVGANFAFS